MNTQISGITKAAASKFCENTRTYSSYLYSELEFGHAPIKR